VSFFSSLFFFFFFFFLLPLALAGVFASIPSSSFYLLLEAPQCRQQGGKTNKSSH